MDATLSGERAGRGWCDAGGPAKADSKRVMPRGPNEIGIDNFRFTPPMLTVTAGTAVTWANDDDVPHLIVNTERPVQAIAAARYR